MTLRVIVSACSASVSLSEAVVAEMIEILVSKRKIQDSRFKASKTHRPRSWSAFCTRTFWWSL